MTEPHSDGASGADDAPDDGDDVLESLKDDHDSADDTDVLDGIGGSPRLTWNSVTDAGGAPVDVDSTNTGDEPAEKSSFAFDLGGALARLAGDDDAPPAQDPPSADSETVVEAPPEPPQRPIVEPDPLPSRAEEIVEPAVASTRSEPIADPDLEPSPTRAEAIVEPDVAPSRSEPISQPDPEPSSNRGEQVAQPETIPTRSEPIADPDPEPLPTRGAAPVEPEPLPSRADHVEAPAAESASTEYPRRVPGTHFDAQAGETADALPTITEATPADASPRPAAKQSVFDDGAPASTPVPGAPMLPGGPNPAGGSAPSLPASNPAPSPLIVEPISSAPSTPDITALRSAQLRASKQQRAGKVFGRSLLAFVLIGGLIAAALVFGRAMLFDTEWDAELTPVVNDVEAGRGAEFEHTVPLEVVSAAEMGDHLRGIAIGDSWVDEVPQWRALGLATGSVSAESVGAALAESTTAVYDAANDRIFLIENVDAEVAAPDLRVALEQAFEAQVGEAPAVEQSDTGMSNGFVGVSSLQSISERSVDVAILASGAVVQRQPANETLPFPIAYELAAVNVLGGPILASVGVDASDVPLGGPYPEGVATALDDDPGTAASAVIELGEVSLAPPVALGNDDWSLVWGARLPETTVDRLIDQVDADSYRPVDRSGTVCFVAIFQTTTEANGASVFSSMLSWVANAPVASSAVATQLSPTRVQLEACDPGVEGGVVPNIGVVDALIDRQQVRLAN